MFTPSKGWKVVGLTGCLAVLVACGGGGDAATPSTSLTLSLPASYVLKWSDEFNSAGAPSPFWTYDEGAPLLGNKVWGNSEQQYYTRDPANVFVGNGMLTIQPVQGVPFGAPTGGVFNSLLATSARIKTDTTAYYNALNATPYGFYEIRAKVPCVAGAWPAIWMMGKYGTWPARGEVDIMEWFGKWLTTPPYETPNQVLSAIHTSSQSGENARSAKRNVDDFCNAFHRFQMHWMANEILIGVEGIPTFSYKKPSNADSSNWPFDQPAHLILNVAIGGNNGGTVNVSNLPDMTMQVDYVKVWQAP